MGICGSIDSPYCKKYCEERKKRPEEDTDKCKRFEVPLEKKNTKKFLVTVKRKHKDYGIEVEVEASEGKRMLQKIKQKAFNQLDVEVFSYEKRKD